MRASLKGRGFDLPLEGAKRPPREFEPQNKEPQNIEVKNILSLLSKTSAVRNSLFDIVLRTPHPAGGSPVSIFKIEKRPNSAPYRTERLSPYNLKQSQLFLTTPIKDPAVRGRT
jgi:hypothetical protein